MSRSLAPFYALALLVAAISACTSDPGQPGGNENPETGLVFVGDLDTTLYIQEVRWWGSDPDGEVTGFEYRWSPAAPVAGFDTNWVFTTDVRDTFALPTPDGHSEYTFFVRALDDRGGVDPSPASQSYPFRNAAPSCSLSNTFALQDTLFPSITLQWIARDPDGNGTLDRFLIWHDANPMNPLVVEDERVREAALGPSFFTKGGDRTVYIQAVDTGQRGSPPDSLVANFLEADARVLLVDDMLRNDGRGESPPPGSGFARYTDFFFATNLDTFYRQGRKEDYAVLDLESYPIRSGAQARGLLDAYDTIVWYDQITDSTGSASLVLTQPLLADWVAAGGRIMLISTYAIGTNIHRSNPVMPDTVPEALFPNFDPRFRRLTVGVDSILWNAQTLSARYELVGGKSLGLLNIRLDAGFINPSFDIFTTTAGTVPIYTIPAGSRITSIDTLAVDGRAASYRDTGAGRFVYIGFPYSRMEGLPDVNLHAEFRKLLAILEGES